MESSCLKNILRVCTMDYLVRVGLVRLRSAMFRQVMGWLCLRRNVVEDLKIELLEDGPRTRPVCENKGYTHFFFLRP